MHLALHCVGFVLFCIVAAGAIYNEEGLRMKLLTNYDPSGLPANTTLVSLGITVTHFTMNEELQSVDLDIEMKMSWVDPRLVWNEKDYPDIEYLTFHKNDIWNPAFMLFNGVGSEANIMQNGDIKAILYSHGAIALTNPTHLKAPCIMDMTYWPYDVHNCTLEIGSWVYSGNQINVTIDPVLEFKGTNSVASLSTTISRSEWEVVGNNIIRFVKKYKCCPEEYISVRINLVLKRIGSAYWWTQQMPVVVIGLLTLVMFVLPFTAEEKNIFGAILFFVDVYFLLNLSSTIGHSSNHTPLIVQLMSLQLLYTGISIIINGLIVRIPKNFPQSRLSPCVKILLDALAKFFCLGKYLEMTEESLLFNNGMKENLEMHQDVGQSSLDTVNRREFQGKYSFILAAILERIFLIVFLVIFLVTTIAFSEVL